MNAPLTTSVDRAARALRGGGVVAFPTETVYGLGAVADDEAAVRRVFAIKGRPADHPLIVHLADVRWLDDWAGECPDWARVLAAAVWPGPLTLVVPRAVRVLDVVTGGQATVGLRVPDHPAALDLLRAVGTGVAGPSANRFGAVSPTTAEHVAADLGERLDPARDLVLDGGPCRVGVESTIVLAVDDHPRVLRPGAVSEEQITAITGREVLPADDSVRAPGTLPAHYSPRAVVDLLAEAELAGAADPTVDTGLIAPAAIATPHGVRRLASPADSQEYARDLYRALRAADDAGLARVLAVPPAGGDGLAVAVRDRLRRAAH